MNIVAFHRVHFRSRFALTTVTVFNCQRVPVILKLDAYIGGEILDTATPSKTTRKNSHPLLKSNHTAQHATHVAIEASTSSHYGGLRSNFRESSNNYGSATLIAIERTTPIDLTSHEPCAHVSIPSGISKASPMYPSYHDTYVHAGLSVFNLLRIWPIWMAVQMRSR